MRKYIIFLFIILALILIPISFASDNSTYDDSLISLGDSENTLSSNEIYFDSSAENDGNGSQSNPFKYLSKDKIQDNSILYFADGQYDLDQDISFSNLTITGNSLSKTIINGYNLKVTSVNNLYISKVTLNGLILKNSEDLTLKKVIVQNCYGTPYDRYGNIFGGAIYLSGSGTTLIESSTFKNNNATYGGAIYASGPLQLKIVNSVFENNSAYKYGGAIATEKGVNLEITNSNFVDCYTITNAGGAIYTKDSTLNVKKTNFTSCNATFGGAICDLNSNTVVNSIIAKDNIADYQGGAFYKMYGSTDIKSSTFTNNKALNGGAVFGDNSSSFSVTSSSFTQNTATYVGGAIYTILNTKESVKSNTYKNNKAGTENNYYKSAQYDLFIGNGNYTLIKGDFEFDGKLPAKYDLREYGQVNPVKNQKSSSNCWAFTSNDALESCILKATGKAYDLSEENMKNVIAYYSDYGWKLETNKGGYDDMGIGYLLSWLGAIPEDLETFSEFSVLSPVLDSSIHVQNLVFLTRTNYTDNDDVKEAIIKYGAVATSVYYSSSYMKSNSYYYSGTSGANHAVTIVGWDDTYSKSNFKTTPQGDGAWICKNSWGETWGDKGYFYISYYDTRCVRLGESQKSTYTFILNDTIHFDKNYQYDIIGATDYLITGKDTIWYENIFNATDNELLAAFSTYFNATTNWTAQIYVNNNLKLTQSGISSPGYYTFNLNQAIPLAKGDTFKIVIKISCDKFASFPISEKVRSNRVLYSKGLSFFSFDGKEWTDLYDFVYDASEYQHSYDSQVACIKAFTTLDKLNTKTSIRSDSSIFVNSPTNITATVKDQYGNVVNYGSVKFTMGNNTYNKRIVDGVATLTTIFDSKGIYNVKADYIGNNYYNSSSNSKNINVSFTDAELTLKISDVSYGQKIVIENSLTSNGIKVKGNINVKINSKVYSLKSNTKTTISDIFNPGKYTAYGNFLDIANTSATFNVKKLPISMSMDIKKSDVDANITIKLSKSIDDDVEVTVNSDKYSLKTKNGVANLALTDLDYGNYVVKAVFTDDYYEDASADGKFTIDYVKTHLIADDVTMYYHDNTRFYVSLVDKNNKAIANEIVIITINGVDYSRVTGNDGKCSIPLQLNSGEFTVDIVYSGNGKYLPSNLTKKVLIKPTILSKDVTKIFRNDTQFYATILDYKGNIVKNTVVRMNINGVYYDRTTNDKGIVKLNLNLAQGKYVLTTINPITGEYASNNITIIPSITENKDLVKYFRNDSRYSVKILGPNGSPLANAKVYFNINGVIYEKTTNSDGMASLGINLNPGDYVITTEHNGCRVSNKIKVLPTIKSSDLRMKYLDGSKFNVTILDGLGKPYPSQTVQFNINGVLYYRTTNDLGVASLNIKLLPGKYIITSSYNGLNAANNVTISS